MRAQRTLGEGIGWRGELALAIERRRSLGFVELIAEDYFDHPLPQAIENLRERGVAIIPHGITLSLGGADLPDARRLAKLARLAERVEAPLVSEHLAFVHAGGLTSGHLLPVPRTQAALDIVVTNIRKARQVLGVPLAVENIAPLVEWPDAELSEGAFLRAVLEQTDSLLLLDIENLYANSINHGVDPITFLSEIPLQRLAYVHIAGGHLHEGTWHDTHTSPVADEVLTLLSELASRVVVPGVMLERDDRFPGIAELHAELDAIAAAVARGARRREAVHVP